MFAESRKIYSTPQGIPVAENGVMRILTGGKFDWPLHRGHKDFLHALSDIPHNASLFIDPDNTHYLERILTGASRNTELWVALTRDQSIQGRLDMRPILPERVRATQLVAIPEIAGVLLSDGDLFADAQVVGAHAVGFSTTTKGFESEERKRIREKVRALGMYSLVLPQLVNLSTTMALEEFFLGKQVQEFRIPTSDGLQFPLLYSEDLVLTPDQSSVEIAREVNRQLVKEGKHKVRMLEMGVGSGIFTTSMIVQSDHDTLGEIHISDIDTKALAIADFNITRALAFKDVDPREVLTVSKSDWYKDLDASRYDLIYVNPPFFTQNVNPPKEFLNNPHHALYPPNLTYHYEEIFAQLGERVSNGGMAVIRVPRTDAKVSLIKNVALENLNGGVVEINDVVVGDGRYLIIKFPFERKVSPEYHDESDAIKNRVDTALQVNPPKIEDWFSMTDGEFESLQSYCCSIQTETAKSDKQKNLDADTLFWEHITMMDKMMTALWNNTEFKKIIPEGMGLNYLRTLVLMHDFSRLIFNSQVQIRNQDIISEALITHIFPQSHLLEFMHSIRWMTGEREVEEPNKISLILKALDTLGKKDRDPKTLQLPEGQYQKKFQRQMRGKAFPLDVPVVGNLGNGVRQVSVDEYINNDVEITLRGVELIETLTGQDFMDFKNDALS